MFDMCWGNQQNHAFIKSRRIHVWGMFDTCFGGIGVSGMHYGIYYILYKNPLSFAELSREFLHKKEASKEASAEAPQKLRGSLRRSPQKNLQKPSQKPISEEASHRTKKYAWILLNIFEH